MPARANMEGGAKPTPGPLRADFAGGYGRVGIYVGDTLLGTAHQVGRSDDRIDLAEANAALWAAAPDLYEALENLCRSIEYWAGCDEGCDPDTASSEIMSSGGVWPAEAYDKARAALTRARGGEA